MVPALARRGVFHTWSKHAASRVPNWHIRAWWGYEVTKSSQKVRPLVVKDTRKEQHATPRINSWQLDALYSCVPSCHLTSITSDPAIPRVTETTLTAGATLQFQRHIQPPSRQRRSLNLGINAKTKSRSSCSYDFHCVSLRVRSRGQYPKIVLVFVLV